MANSKWSKRFIAWIETVRMERASGDMALKVHLAELLHIRQTIAELNRSIRALSVTDGYRDNVRVLETVPGISTLTAMTLLTELCDISRFKTLDKLCSYVGLIHWHAGHSGGFFATRRNARWLVRCCCRFSGFTTTAYPLRVLRKRERGLTGQF